MLELPAIKQFLPHRHPILQLDRVLEIEPGRRLVAIKAVSGSEPCYADIADNLDRNGYAYPVSLIVESLGQAGALLWLYTARRTGQPVDSFPIFGSARDCRLDGSAYPGDVLRHEVELEVVKEDNAFFRGETWVGEHRIATIDSMLAVARPQLSA